MTGSVSKTIQLSAATLLRQVLYEVVDQAIELHWIIDEQRVSFAVEPLPLISPALPRDEYISLILIRSRDCKAAFRSCACCVNVSPLPRDPEGPAC
jgi:hypothetical protein